MKRQYIFGTLALSLALLPRLSSAAVDEHVFPAQSIADGLTLTASNALPAAATATVGFDATFACGSEFPWAASATDRHAGLFLRREGSVCNLYAFGSAGWTLVKANYPESASRSYSVSFDLVQSKTTYAVAGETHTVGLANAPQFGLCADGGSNVLCAVRTSFSGGGSLDSSLKVSFTAADAPVNPQDPPEEPQEPEDPPEEPDDPPSAPTWTFTSTGNLKGTITDGTWKFEVNNNNGGDTRWNLKTYLAGSGVLDMSAFEPWDGCSWMYMPNVPGGEGVTVRFEDVVTKVVFPSFLGAQVWGGSSMVPGSQPDWFNCNSGDRFKNVREADFSRCEELIELPSMYTYNHPALRRIRLPAGFNKVNHATFTGKVLTEIYWKGPAPSVGATSAWKSSITNFVLRANAESWAAACAPEYPLAEGTVGQLKSDLVGGNKVYVAFYDEGAVTPEEPEEPDQPGTDPEEPDDPPEEPDDPPEEPDDPPSGDTVRLNVLFTGAAYGVYEQTVAKGQSTAVDFSPLVKNVSVAAASASDGTVSGSTLTLPASALGADLTVNVMLRESASAGAVEVNGWKTRLANADVNDDGIVKVLALGHSYVDDVSSYFADAVAQMRALGDTTKFVYCNSFYPGARIQEDYTGFLKSDSDKVTMRAFYTDDVPAAERPKRADGTVFPSRTGAWGDYYAGKMSDHLKACDDWDLIVINEGVHAIPSSSTISSYKALIREKLKAWGCTTEPLIGWYMTWAWGPLATTTTCNLSLYYQNSSDVHYSKIVEGVESCKGQFDFVIPVGTALQNLAALEPHNTANAPDYKGTSSRFQRDGTCHLDFICGRWAATLAYLSTLGFDVSGTHFPNERKYENEGATFVMRPVQDVMCHLCANAAIAKPAAVTAQPWASADYEFPCARGTSHAYGAAKAVAKTCTADGYTTKTCAACGYEHRTAWTPMSHEETSVVTAPDCTHAGYTTHTCSDCGKSYETDRVKALGHDYAETVDKAACSVTYTCRRAGCGKTYVKVYNHLVKNWTVTKAPTYTAKGERQGTCEICGATVTEEVDVLNDFAFHWDYSNPDDAAATLARIKTFCTTKEAGNQFEYVPDEGVLRFWAGMDPFISWDSMWFNGAQRSITRGFEILTPEGKTPRSFTLKGGTGKYLQPVGSMSRSYTDPGVIFAKDDGGYWSYQICCKCDGTLLYYFCYTGYSSNSAQWAPGGNGTAYPILDVNGEAVDFGNAQQNNKRNQLNFLAENGFLSGEKLTEQTVGSITYQYDVTVADDGKITVQGSLHYDRDGVTWTAKGAARVFDPETDFNKVGNNSHDSTGLVPVFGLHHKPYADPSGELRSANDKGYNTTDVTAIDAIYE